MNTSEALQLSRKGGLMYDSSWYKHGRLHETIINCTSPPKLSSEFTISALNSPFVAEDVKNKSDIAQVFPLPTKGTQNTTADETSLSVPSDSETVVRLNKLDNLQSTNGKVEVSIQECEQQWDKLSKERADKRRYQVKEHSRQLLEQAGKSSIIFSEQQVEKKRMQLQNMQYIQQESEERRQLQLQHQQDCCKLHVKRMEVKLKTALQKKAEAEVEAEHNRRVAERQAYLESMMNVHKQIAESSKKVCHQLDRYKHKEFLPPDSETVKKNVELLTQQAEHLISCAKLSGASMDLVDKMHKIIESLMVCQEFASRFIAEADRLVQEDTARKVREASIAQHHAIIAAAATTYASTKVENSVSYSSPIQDNGNAENVLQKTISADALNDYDSLQNKHKLLVESYQMLAKTTDPQLKKYRFDLQKAVNVPVNAISNQSAAHLLDKLKRLKSLLSGQMVDISGRKVSVSQNSQAKAFVKDLLAKKIVKQSDEQVSSNFDSAFALAAVAVALWCDFPDLGDCMLAHFFLKCPFLVPYNITKSQDQSNEEYYKSLGYNYENDGTIEKQDKYLRRMSGFMRLYAAIMITQPILTSQKVHPHGIDRAWKWLARLLNVEPQPDITATMLFDFLEVCGHALSATYNKQFFKLVQVLHRSYFPKIEAVTPKGSGGPVVRLKNFLEIVIKTQRIAQPKGKLQSDFWKT